MLLVLLLVSCTVAQLNFSPGWGKRASSSGRASSSSAATNPGDASDSALHPNGLLVGGGSGGLLPQGGVSSTLGDNCGTIPFAAVKHIYRLIRVSLGSENIWATVGFYIWV